MQNVAERAGLIHDAYVRSFRFRLQPLAQAINLDLSCADLAKHFDLATVERVSDSDRLFVNIQSDK